MNRQRLAQVFYAKATGAAEVIMAVTMLSFGLPFLFGATNDFAQFPAYHQMASLMSSERAWGVLLVGCSVWRFVEACGESYGRRVAATAVAMFVWAEIFLSFAMGQSGSPGVPVFGARVLLELWTLFRIRRTPGLPA